MRSHNPRTHVALGFILLWMSGCATHINPVLSPLPPSLTVPNPPESTLSVNVRVGLSQLGTSLNDAIPPNFDTSPYCTAFGLACVQGYLTREPIRLNLSGNHLSLNSLIHYQLDGSFLGIPVGSCGRPDNTRRRVAVAYDANLALGKDWKLKVSDAKTTVSPVDRCRVTLKNFDKTDQAMDVFKHVLDGFTAQAQEKLTGSTAIRDRANEAWHVLANSIPLDSTTLLELNPEAIGITPINVANETLSATLTVKAKPVIIVGATVPPAEATSDVPPLGDFSSDGQFRLMTVVKLPFEFLNNQLAQVAVGKEFAVPGIFGTRRAKIVSTKLTGSGNNIVVGLDLDGSVRGTAWLTGKINYGPADRILTIEIVDLDVDTKNALVNAVQWLSPQFLLNTVRSAIGDFRLDVGQKSDEFRERARQALNRQISTSVQATTKFDAPEIRGPFSDNSNFIFTISLRGSSQLDVTPPGEPLPSGNEIRYVSVFFETGGDGDDRGDDKDAEEPVTLSLLKNGVLLAQRQVGVSERWGNSPPENQGPYFLSIPLTERVTDCKALQLRIRKEPAGSDTGKGWKNVMHARVYLANGTDVPAARSPFDQWGDGDDHPYERTFGLCDRTP